MKNEEHKVAKHWKLCAIAFDSFSSFHVGYFPLSKAGPNNKVLYVINNWEEKLDNEVRACREPRCSSTANTTTALSPPLVPAAAPPVTARLHNWECVSVKSTKQETLFPASISVKIKMNVTHCDTIKTLDNSIPSPPSPDISDLQYHSQLS